MIDVVMRMHASMPHGLLWTVCTVREPERRGMRCGPCFMVDRPCAWVSKQRRICRSCFAVGYTLAVARQPPLPGTATATSRIDRQSQQIAFRSRVRPADWRAAPI